MLTESEDKALVEFITYMARRAFPITRNMLKCYVMAIIKKGGRENETLFNMDNGPRDKWIKQFLDRHPHIREKLPELQDKSRSRMANETVLN